MIQKDGTKNALPNGTPACKMFLESGGFLDRTKKKFLSLLPNAFSNYWQTVYCIKVMNVSPHFICYKALITFLIWAAYYTGGET